MSSEKLPQVTLNTILSVVGECFIQTLQKFGHYNLELSGQCFLVDLISELCLKKKYMALSVERFGVAHSQPTDASQKT